VRADLFGCIRFSLRKSPACGIYYAPGMVFPARWQSAEATLEIVTVEFRVKAKEQME